GLAGAVGGLESGDPNLPQAFSDLGYAATSFYALGDTELAALNAKISAGETINSAAWNDNDDSWVVGIWAVDQTWPFGGAGSGSLDGLFLAAGTGGGVSLDLASFGVPPDTIAAAGVFVALREGAAD